MQQAIDQKVEGPKIDFKREVSLKGEEFAELLKDLCSIVNTDDPDHYRGEGYLIIGVTRDGQFHLLPQDFDADKMSASLNDTLNKYLAPPLHVRVVGPFSHANGQYAVIQIPVSSDQPHMVIKETGSAKPNQWWVRVGDTKTLAGPQDYTRVLRKAVARETTPLHEALVSTRALLGNLEQRFERLQAASVQQSGLPIADSSDLDVAAKIRVQYGTPDVALKQALHREMLLFLENFEAQFPDKSVQDEVNNWEPLKQKIEALELLTKPLGEGLATAVLYGNGELDDVVGQVLVQVMEKTLTFPAYGSLNDTVRHLRAYPHILLMFTVFAAAVQAKRVAWLKRYVNTESRHFLQNGSSNMLEQTRNLVRWEGIFRQLYRIESCAPAYQHVIDVTVGAGGWLSDDDPFTNDLLLLSTAELLQSLMYQGLPDEKKYYSPTPIPNTLVYRYDANDLIRQILKQDSNLLQSALDHPLNDVLSAFITTVAKYSKTDGFGCWVLISAEAISVE